MKPIMRQAVYPSQRGFLESTPANVFEDDCYLHMEARSQRKRGGIFFSDIIMAFRTVDHQYIHALLLAIGTPGWLIAVIGRAFSWHSSGAGDICCF